MTTSFVLQDSRSHTGDNLMFWAQAGGYTSDLARAEVFDEAAAFAQHASRHSDVPWPLAYVQQHTHRVVDMQYVKADVARAWPDQSRFYCQDKSQGFVGNDLVFLAGNQRVIHLADAEVFTREDALFNTSVVADRVFWPVGYLESISRIAVNRHHCHSVQALQGTGRTLAVLRPPAKERYRCHHCNIFLKATDYYGTCPRCGGDNRP